MNAYPAGIWAIDFEFTPRTGETPIPLCVTGIEINSGQRVSAWLEGQELACPYPVGPDSAVVAWYASAEIGCHLALGWPIPHNVIDLFTEFRRYTNQLTEIKDGRKVKNGQKASLLAALLHFGIRGIDATEKTSMQELAIQGGPYTQKEKEALIAYCFTDTEALKAIWPYMLKLLDGQRTLLRGAAMVAAAHIEHVGIPFDLPIYKAIRNNWEKLKFPLIESVDKKLVEGLSLSHGVFDGGTFKEAWFEEFLTARNIDWPRYTNGKLILKDSESFKPMAQLYPELNPLRDLRGTLKSMASAKLDININELGRHRCILSAFRSQTGRYQPSSTGYIFGLPAWYRCLIKPSPGFAVAYLDYVQQEIGIAGKLSGDKALQAVYASPEDSYVMFGKLAGLLMTDATKKSHPIIRELCKTCLLGTGYGMGAQALARAIGKSLEEAQYLLDQHKRNFWRFWQWVEEGSNFAHMHGYLPTAFGWKARVTSFANPRSLQNFPMQANGAEMLRLACCLVINQGINIIAPVHDAMMIEAPIAQIEQAVETTKEYMVKASQYVLDGFNLRVDAHITRYPDRYIPDKPIDLWNWFMERLQI